MDEWLKKLYIYIYAMEWGSPTIFKNIGGLLRHNLDRESQILYDLKDVKQANKQKTKFTGKESRLVLPKFGGRWERELVEGGQKAQLLGVR